MGIRDRTFKITILDPFSGFRGNIAELLYTDIMTTHESAGFTLLFIFIFEQSKSHILAYSLWFVWEG